MGACVGQQEPFAPVAEGEDLLQRWHGGARGPEAWRLVQRRLDPKGRGREARGLKPGDLVRLEAEGAPLLAGLRLEAERQYKVAAVEARGFLLESEEKPGQELGPIVHGFARCFLFADGQPASSCFAAPKEAGPWVQHLRKLYAPDGLNRSMLTVAEAAEHYDQLQSPAPRNLKPSAKPGGEAYGGLEAAAYVRQMLRSPGAAKRAASVKRPEAGLAMELLRRWQAGELAVGEGAYGGPSYSSLAPRGFVGGGEKAAPFAGEGDYGRRGLAVVSMPEGSQEEHARIVRICLEDAIHFAVVRECNWGAPWFFIWLRTTLDALLAGAVPVVLTQERGNIDFAQSVEVEAMNQLDIPYKVVDIQEFLARRRPFHFDESFRRPGRAAPPQIKGELRQVMAKCDERGLCALASFGERCAECEWRTRFLGEDREKEGRLFLGLVKELLAEGADLEQRDDEGRTLLHLVAKQRNDNAVWEVLKLGADPRALNSQLRTPRQEMTEAWKLFTPAVGDENGSKESTESANYHAITGWLEKAEQSPVAEGA